MFNLFLVKTAFIIYTDNSGVAKCLSKLIFVACGYKIYDKIINGIHFYLGRTGYPAKPDIRSFSRTQNIVSDRILEKQGQTVHKLQIATFWKLYLYIYISH